MVRDLGTPFLGPSWTVRGSCHGHPGQLGAPLAVLDVSWAVLGLRAGTLEFFSVSRGALSDRSGQLVMRSFLGGRSLFRCVGRASSGAGGSLPDVDAAILGRARTPPPSPSLVSLSYLEGAILVGYFGNLFLGPSWTVLGGCQGHSGQLGAPSAILDVSWAVLGLSAGPLQLSRVSLGALSDRSGRLFGRSWAVLVLFQLSRRSEPLLEPRKGLFWSRGRFSV